MQNFFFLAFKESKKEVEEVGNLLSVFFASIVMCIFRFCFLVFLSPWLLAFVDSCTLLACFLTFSSLFYCIFLHFPIVILSASITTICIIRLPGFLLFLSQFLCNGMVAFLPINSLNSCFSLACFLASLANCLAAFLTSSSSIYCS